MAATVAAAAAPLPCAGAEADPKKGAPFFTPALNAYSFLELLNENMADATRGIDLFGVVDFCERLRIPAVDLTGYFFPGYPQAPADSYVNRMKRYVHERGIVISGTGVKNDFATADKEVRAAGVALRGPPAARAGATPAQERRARPAAPRAAARWAGRVRAGPARPAAGGSRPTGSGP